MAPRVVFVPACVSGRRASRALRALRVARASGALVVVMLTLGLVAGAGEPPPAHGVVGSAWVWPLPQRAIVAPYVAPPHPYGSGHRGIDVAGEEGEDVRAVDDGVVFFAGVVVDRPVLSIAHDGGVLSSYEPVTATVIAGDAVVAGQVVGRLESGHCLEACLHLGARQNGEYLNPVLFLGGLEPSVLLPLG